MGDHGRSPAAAAPWSRTGAADQAPVPRAWRPLQCIRADARACPPSPPPPPLAPRRDSSSHGCKRERERRRAVSEGKGGGRCKGGCPRHHLGRRHSFHVGAYRMRAYWWGLSVGPVSACSRAASNALCCAGVACSRLGEIAGSLRGESEGERGRVGAARLTSREGRRSPRRELEESDLACSRSWMAFRCRRASSALMRA